MKKLLLIPLVALVLVGCGAQEENRGKEPEPTEARELVDSYPYMHQTLVVPSEQTFNADYEIDIYYFEGYILTTDGNGYTIIRNH